MFHKFYGLTGVNIVLSGMPAKLYVRCLENFKNEPEILALVAKQFEMIEEVVNSIPNEYSDPKDKRTFAKLRILEKNNPNDPQIQEIKEYLEGRPRDIAPFVYVNGERCEINEISKSIILYLKNHISTVVRFKNFININKSMDKEVLFFNQPLYRLKNFSRARLSLLTSSVLKTYNSRTGLTDDFWNYVDRFVSGVSEYVSDEQEQYENLSDDLLSDVSNFISKLDYSYFNQVLGLNATEEDYHKTSLELYNIGLIGFTPFIKEMYSEFNNSFKPNYVSDLHISKSTDLYKFIVDLDRASKSNLKLGDPLTAGEDVSEIDIDLDV